MKNMRFKVGDRVKVKSLQWFNENFDDDYNVVFADGWHFSEPMSIFCGKELIIEKISHATNPPHYKMKDNIFAWTDEMFEGLAEEEVGLVDNLSSRWVNEFNLPNGYIFKDENGNVINATKIVLEKKKKEYPKTYEECCKVLGMDSTINHVVGTHFRYRDRIMSFIKLLICRDAYWKIAGEEMGLWKPWKPDYKNPDIDLYVIINIYNQVEKAKYGYGFQYCTFTFPTPEMRDAFYENFKGLIEQCKELL